MEDASWLRLTVKTQVIEVRDGHSQRNVVGEISTRVRPTLALGLLVGVGRQTRVPHIPIRLDQRPLAPARRALILRMTLPPFFLGQKVRLQSEHRHTWR